MVVLGVSFDEPEANKHFIEKFSFPFSILSDADKSISKAYGAATTDDAKYANRITVVVGADGRVERIYDKVDATTHADTVLKDLSPASPSR